MSQLAFWQKNFVYAFGAYIPDGQGNIQKLTAPGGGGTSGATLPSWTQTTTPDNGLTWTFFGLGGVIAELQKPNQNAPYLQIFNEAVSFSRGTADAGAIVLLNSSGQLDPSMGGGGGGSTVSVNGTTVSSPNFIDSASVTWSVVGSNIQATVTGSVTSVFGRTGAVVAQTGDYTVAQITGAAPLASPTFTGTVTEANVHITGTLADGANSVGTSGQLLSSTVTGTAWVSQSSLSIATSQLTGTLQVSQGGTGAVSFTMHGVLIGEGTTTVSSTSAGVAGQVLTSNGPGADPTFQPSGSSGVSSVNGITGAVVIVAGTGITVTPAGQNITIATTGSSSTSFGRHVISTTTYTTVVGDIGKALDVQTSAPTVITLQGSPVPTFIQYWSTAGGSGVNVLTSTSRTVSAGNLLVAKITVGNSVIQTVSTVTDTLGNTWHRAAGTYASNGGLFSGTSVETWYAFNITGGSVQVTATWPSGGGFSQLEIIEASQILASSDPFDAGGNASSSSSIQNLTVVTTQVKDFIVGGFLTASTGCTWANLTDAAGGGNTTDGYTVDNSTGSFTATSSGCTSNNFVGTIAAFKAAAQTSLFSGFVQNNGTSTVNITPSSGLINGLATLQLTPGEGATIATDGTNFTAVKWVTGSGGNSRTTATITTGVLNQNAVESGTIMLAKTFSLIKVSVNVPSRLRLYSTTGARDADVNRQPQVPPDSSKQNGVIVDIYLNASTGVSWVINGDAGGSDAKAVPDGLIGYNVTNISGATQSVVWTIIYLPEES